MLDPNPPGDAAIALERSEARFRALFDHSPTLSATLDPHGVIQSVNRHGAAELGYPKASLLGFSLFDHVHLEDRAGFAACVHEAATSHEVSSCDIRLFRRDGRCMWVRASARSMADSEGRAVLLLACKDLTEHKEAVARLLEHQTRLRLLTKALRLAEEKERRRIASCLHDAVGHSLALARIKLGAFRRPHGSGELLEVDELIAEAIEATRSLTFELSPPLLYEVGLEAALEAMGERLVESNGLALVFYADAAPKPLGLDTKVVLYRLVEELLINVLKHAQADSVRMSVVATSDEIEIAVSDDGVGLEDPEAGAPSRATAGHGLLSLREQLKALGGRLVVETAPGQGTTMRICAPLEASQ